MQREAFFLAVSKTFFYSLKNLAQENVALDLTRGFKLGRKMMTYVPLEVGVLIRNIAGMGVIGAYAWSIPRRFLRITVL